MSDTLTPLERDLLTELAAREEPAERSPAALAVALDVDLSRVLDTVADLRGRGLLEREGFDSCRVTEQGRIMVTDTG